MGGLCALVWPRYTKRRVVAVAANCPVCDLPFHYTERPDLPRTLRAAFGDVRVSDDVAAYIMDIIERTRSSEKIANGVSARGSLALYRASQIYAAMQGRDYVIPEDVRKEALCVLPHRIILISSSHNDNTRFLASLIEEIEVPLEKV